MKKRYILLIDDNNIDCFIANHIIVNSQLADKVIMQNSAVEALVYLRKALECALDFPDLIFLDIAMPMMDGFAFLDELIKFKPVMDGDCVVVMLTSSGNDKDIDRAKAYSCVKDYFVKPLTLEMLERLM